jgi:hypothetical protein
MASRLKLHEVLCEILGTRNVYFQPPESVKMTYPAIVYSRSNIKNTFADSSVYTQGRAYEVTVIDRNPDSEIVDKVSKLPKCRFVTHYTSNNLNHDKFTIFD